MVSSVCFVLALYIITCNTEITKHGLIIVDIQYDFTDPSGSLSVFGGGKNGYLDISSSEYVERINKYIENEANRFDFIAYSIDYHPTGHCSFATTMQTLGASVNAFQAINPSDSENIGQPWEDDICISQTGYQVLWPDHCVLGSNGAKFMPELIDIRPLPHLQSQDDLRRVVIWRDPIKNELYVTNYKLSGSYLMEQNASFKSEIDHVLSDMTTQKTFNVSQVMYVFKGRDLNIDSYSVFDGNDGITRTGLFDALNAYDYTPANTDLTIFGIAYDYCVVFTCRDAVDHGYHVTIMDQLTAPVDPSVVDGLKQEMMDIGMTINYSYGSYETTTTRVTNVDNKEEDDNGVSGEVVAIIILVIIIICLIGALMWVMFANKNKGVASVSTVDDEVSPVNPTDTLEMR
eukprot:516513_1